MSTAAYPSGDAIPSPLAVLAAARAWFIGGVTLADRLPAQLAEKRARTEEAIGEGLTDFGAEVRILSDPAVMQRDSA